MGFLVEIHNKYEIIAILREHIKNKGGIIKRTGHTKKDLELKSISYDHIVLCEREIDIGEEFFSCEMYCSLGLVTYELVKGKAPKGESLPGIICEIPKKLTITQRRKHPRICFDQDLNYTGTGRLKNGIMYKLKIKDLSEGGCALFTDQDGIQYDSMLRHVVLNFQEFGVYITTLNVKKITTNPEGTRLSCQFIFKDDDEKIKIENIVIRLNLTKKRK